MYKTNKYIPAISTMILGIFFTVSSSVGDMTLLSENFDSYADGDWPT